MYVHTHIPIKDTWKWSLISDLKTPRVMGFFFPHSITLSWFSMSVCQTSKRQHELVGRHWSSWETQIIFLDLLLAFGKSIQFSIPKSTNLINGNNGSVGFMLLLCWSIKYLRVKHFADVIYFTGPTVQLQEILDKWFLDPSGCKVSFLNIREGWVLSPIKDITSPPKKPCLSHIVIMLLSSFAKYFENCGAHSRVQTQNPNYQGVIYPEFYSVLRSRHRTRHPMSTVGDIIALGY